MGLKPQHPLPVPGVDDAKEEEKNRKDWEQRDAKRAKVGVKGAEVDRKTTISRSGRVRKPPTNISLENPEFCSEGLFDQSEKLKKYKANRLVGEEKELLDELLLKEEATLSVPRRQVGGWSKVINYWKDVIRANRGKENWKEIVRKEYKIQRAVEEDRSGEREAVVPNQEEIAEMVANAREGNFSEGFAELICGVTSQVLREQAPEVWAHATGKL